MLSMMPTGCSAWRRDIDVADATAVGDECIAAGAPPDTVVVQPCDCTREEQVRAAQVAAYKAFGRVHLLMNNAAVQTNNRCGPYEHPDRWRRILDTNLFGARAPAAR